MNGFMPSPDEQLPPCRAAGAFAYRPRDFYPSVSKGMCIVLMPTVNEGRFVYVR